MLSPPPVKARLSPAMIEWVAGLGAFIVVVAYTLRKARVLVDDAWITLAYARNIAEGRGMVFQQGEYLLGTTTPLWCWLNAVFMAMVPSRIETGGAVLLFAGASHLFAAVSLVRFAKLAGIGRAAWIAGFVWLLLADHIFLTGMEYGLATGLALEAIIALARRRPVVAGSLAAALCLARPEAALLALLLGGAWLLPHWRARSARAVFSYAIPLVVVGVATLAGFKLYFGSALPNTLSGKQDQLALGGDAVSWLDNIAVGTWRFLVVEWLRGPILPVFFVLVGAFSSVTNLKDRSILIFLFGWAGVQLVALAALGIPFYPWYLYPTWICLAVLTALGVDALIRREKAGNCKFPVITCAAVTLLLAGMQSRWAGDPAAFQRGRFEGYRQLANTINGRAPESEAVLCQEIGVVRYFLAPRHRIIDEMLLVTENPTPGRFPSRADFVRLEEPRFIIESHPVFHGMTEEQRGFQDLRRHDSFVLHYEGSDGFTLVYTLVERVESAYGIQVLFELSRE